MKGKKFAGQHEETHLSLPGLSGLEALAEVSRHHGQSSQNALLSQHTELLGINATAIPLSMPMATSAARPPSIARDLSFAAMQALVPGQPGLHNSSLELDDSLVDYSHGEVLNTDVQQARHDQGAARHVSSRSPESMDNLVDYSYGQPPTIEENYARHHQSLPVRDTLGSMARRSIGPLLGRSRASQDRGQPENAPGRDTSLQPSSRDRSFDIGFSAPTNNRHDLAGLNPISALDIQDAQFQIWSPDGGPSQPKKVRGAFAPDRRSAVKEVRKRGACLRCRMLKKSCDSADPCRECAKLENARMWKGQCVRTRLSHVFNVFSSTLFMNIAHSTMEQLRQTKGFTSLPGRLELSYFPTARLFITFSCLEVTTSGPQHPYAKIILNTENEGVGVGWSAFDAKVTQYGLQLLRMHFDEKSSYIMAAEISKVMHHTLQIALTMTSCVLVARAIDLWICVTLLAKNEKEVLAYHEPQLPPSNVPVELGHDREQHGEDAHYVYIQLRRKFERACDVHFKAIMTELEKSLIQRKQADNFETVIGTVLLLRSLEIVGYMYKGFDHLVDLGAQTRKDVLYGADAWPLDNPPSHYWQQGEQFSDLLVSMLRLRKVLPIMQAYDGVVKAENADRNVKEWLEAARLRVDVLQFARDKHYDVVDGNTWELRWMGKLFDT